MAQPVQVNVSYEVDPHLFADHGAQQPAVPQMYREQTPVRRHPIASFFHVFWKVAALFAYLFSYWFSDSFVYIFVSCIVLLSCDFWTTKNVSGRLMVGLRWWNEVKEDGASEWVYESLEDKSVIYPSESRTFWLALFITPLFWLLFAITSILKLNFQWLVIVCVALALNVANIVGYIKCARETKKRIKNMATSYISSQVISSYLGQQV